MNLNKKYKRKFVNIILWKYKKISKTSLLIFLITTLAFYLAWFFASIFVPYLGFISLGPTQITFLSFIVVFATFHLGFIGSFSCGLGFGLSSMFAAYILGVVKYQYFDISVLPRLLMSLIVYALYIVLNVKKEIRIWKFILIAIIAAILNISLTLSFQHLHNKLFGNLKNLLPIKEWIITHPINITCEPLMCGFLATSVYPLVRFLRKKYIQRSQYHW
ncbi:hypothetical protein NPA07_04975 [Mycoplasmopsis caviae]|nr:hypothetical protein [Mycoplasmopsis caviae]UUD35129.1 hypothetical protein NPA07_04975 [Mycoplasmopsis caviae]